jgi:hypothetical protein
VKKGKDKKMGTKKYINIGLDAAKCFESKCISLRLRQLEYSQLA